MRDMDWFSNDIDWFRRAVPGLLAVAAFLTAPLGAHGQSFSIAPEVGVYVPTQPLLTAATGGPNPQFAEFKQEISLSVGGRMALGFGERFGIEVSGAYMPSSLVLSASGVDTTANANLVTGSGQLWVQLLPMESPISFGLRGGVSLTSRGGDAFAGADNTTDVGGVIGATLGLRVGPFVHFLLTAEDYIYNLDTSLVGLPGVDSQTQHDIHLNFGVGIPLLGM